MNVKKLEKLEKLESLKQKGIISEQEFIEIREQIISELLIVNVKDKAKESFSKVFRKPKKGKTLWGYFVFNLRSRGNDLTSKGRACRKEFIGCYLFLLIFSSLTFLLGMLATRLEENILVVLSSIWANIFLVYWVTFHFTVYIRRLHDIGFSGWLHCLLSFSLIISVAIKSAISAVPTYKLDIFIFVLIIASFVLFLHCVFVPSNMKENKYGSIPEEVLD